MGSPWGKWVQQGEDGYSIGRIGLPGRNRLNTGKIGWHGENRFFEGKVSSDLYLT